MLAVLLFFGTASLFLVIFLAFAPQIGGTPSEKSKQKIEAFPFYRNGTFENTSDTRMAFSVGEMLPLIWKSLKGEGEIAPSRPLHVHRFEAAQFTNLPLQEVSFAWFGHSSMLLRFEEQTFLLDPVFSERASMFSFAGPKKFAFSHDVTPDDLPQIDAVIISHDHYDHLDHATIVALKGRVQRYFVPLGVAAHLERWGVPTEQITEVSWWDEIRYNDRITLACTPARHFSGRGTLNRNSTLWAGWAFLSPEKRVYFSGDSGYTQDFKAIGEKYGPFDFAMIECGQYNRQWQVIHMLPEETAQTAADVQAKLFMPVHWGKFPMAFHAWYESPERMITRAEELGVPYALPEIGKVYTLLPDALPTKPWWREQL